MVNESGEVKKFLSQQALFQHLSESDVDALCANTFTSFAKSGTQLIPHNETEPLAPGLIMVRTGSIEIRNTNGVLLDRLSAGDFLIPEAVFKQNPAENYSVTVLEDCLYYELEKKHLRIYVNSIEILNSYAKAIPAVLQQKTIHKAYRYGTAYEKAIWTRVYWITCPARLFALRRISLFGKPRN